MQLLLALLSVLSFVNIVKSNVIGIDFASDSVKVAIVQPGTPLEIVTNFQSKRKTPTMISFYRGERSYGSDALALMSRKPELTFARIYRTLGKVADHPAIKELHSQYFPYEVFSNETTGKTTFKVETDYYTSEELLAMILQHVKDMTHNFGGKVIKDCVITVPSSFTQHEREAVFTAAEIAELNVLTLIEENTAAALQYGMDRTFTEPTAVLYYNMGAGTTKATVVSYSSYPVKEGGKNKTVGQFEVIGKGWDDALGGFNFDVKLANLLADRFNEVWNKKASGKGKDLKDFYKPMNKLRSQATKVKEILSANTEFPVKIEQLHADVDLNTKVSRAEFEEICADLFEKVTTPIDKALAMANLTLADIHAVEIIGGSVRIPKVKKILDEYFKDSKAEIGQHLNGDEAMALGAAFRAANISTAFRVRKIGLTDLTSYGVSVRLETLESDEKPGSGGFGIFGGEKKGKKEESEGDEVWSKFTKLYPSKSPMPSKTKTVAFHYNDDISCKIEYDSSTAANLPEGTDALIAQYNVTGIAEFAKMSTEKGLKGDPKVHLSFGLDSSGIVSLVKAEITIDVPSNETEIEKENKSETEKSDVETEKINEAETNSTEAALNETDSTLNSTSTANATVSIKTNSTSTKEKKKDTVIRKVLKVSECLDAVSPKKWTLTQKLEAKNRLKALQKEDDARKAKEAAMNDLEAYIYKVKNRIAEEEEEFNKISTEEQRKEVVDLANEAEEWLYDEGRDQVVSVYNSKKSEISTKAEAIFKRYKEISARSEAIEKANSLLKDVKKKVNGWKEKMPYITEEETKSVLDAIKLAEDWISEKTQLQEETSPYETPVFSSSEVPVQLKPVSVLFDKMMRKPKPAPVVEKKNSTASDNSTTSGNNTIKVEVESDEETIKVEVEENEEVGEKEETSQETEGDKADSQGDEDSTSDEL